MATERTVGPKEEVAFFNAVSAVFEQYPDMAGKYAIASLALETQMGIDFDRERGISRVEGRRIITEFVDRDKPTPRRDDGLTCLAYYDDGTCKLWGHIDK
jgi:hypothetical protein